MLETSSEWQRDIFPTISQDLAFEEKNSDFMKPIESMKYSKRCRHKISLLEEATAIQSGSAISCINSHIRPQYGVCNGAVRLDRAFKF